MSAFLISDIDLHLQTLLDFNIKLQLCKCNKYYQLFFNNDIVINEYHQFVKYTNNLSTLRYDRYNNIIQHNKYNDILYNVLYNIFKYNLINLGNYFHNSINNKIINYDFFRSISYTGCNLNTFKFIHNICKSLPSQPQNIDMNPVFIYCCKYEYYDFVYYILDNFKIDVNYSNNEGFINCCKNGNLSLMQYIYAYAPIYHFSLAFNTACKYNHFDIVKWLYQISNNNIALIQYCDYDCFRCACINHNIDLAKWLLSIDLKICYKKTDKLYNWCIRYCNKKYSSKYISKIESKEYYKFLGFLYKINDYRAAIYAKKLKL